MFFTPLMVSLLRSQKKLRRHYHISSLVDKFNFSPVLSVTK